MSDSSNVTSAAGSGFEKKPLFSQSIVDEDFRKFLEMHRTQTVRLRNVESATSNRDSKLLPVNSQASSNGSSFDTISKSSRSVSPEPPTLPKLKPIPTESPKPTFDITQSHPSVSPASLLSDSLRSTADSSGFNLRNVIIFTVVSVVFLVSGRYVPLMTFVYGFVCGVIFSLCLGYAFWTKLPPKKNKDRPKVVRLPDVRSLPSLSIPRFLSNQGSTAKFSVFIQPELEFKKKLLAIFFSDA